MRSSSAATRGPGTSPNDPPFYLNRCKVDRIWEAWMDRQPDRRHRPDGSAAQNVPDHDLNDPLVALIGSTMTPAQVLDPSPWYTYDNLDPEP